jgi:hypothetical protein
VKKAIVAGLIAAAAAFGFGLSQSTAGGSAAMPTGGAEPTTSSDDLVFVQDATPDAEGDDSQDEGDRRDGRDCPEKDGDGEREGDGGADETSDVVNQV